MNKPAMILALVGALVLGLYVNAGGQSGAQAEATKVAVVDLQKIVNESKQQADFRANNKTLAESLKAEQKRRQDEIATLTNQIDPLVPGSDEWRKKRDELQEKSALLRVWAEMQEQNNQLEQARQFAQAYASATKAAEDVANAMGYDVVLQSSDLPDLMKLNVQQLQSVVQTRKVIYSSDQVDITSAVLNRVDAEYNQR